MSSTARHRVVLNNASALLAVQIASHIFPFLLLPYLTRVLGASIYGVVAFALSLTQLACILTDYGFALSATYAISTHRDDKQYVASVLGGVFLCKIALLLTATLALMGYALATQKYVNHSDLLLWMLLPLLGQTFQPFWFFQGVEKMVRVTIYSMGSRVVYVGLVFLLVHNSTDAWKIPIAYGCAQISLAALSIWQIYKEGYRIALPDFKTVYRLMHDSTGFFWARAAVAMYTSGGAFFLGLFSTPLQVAYYAAAEQLYRAAQSLLSPMAQALYPHMAKHRNFALLFRTIRWMEIVCIGGCVIGVAAGPWLITFLFGPQFSASYPVLVIFLIILAITTPSILLGYPFLGALGKASLANTSVFVAGILQLVLLAGAYVLGQTSAISVVWCVMIVEALVLSLRAYWGQREYRKYLRSVAK